MRAVGGGPAGGSRPVVSIVWATLNEIDSLPPLLERVRALPLPAYEILVIDDGSRDGTREFLVRAASADPRLHLVFHDGKQTTLRAQGAGIGRARGEYLVIMDADLQHPPEILPAMIAQLEGGAGLVVASRYAPGGTVGPRSPIRAIYSRGAEWLARRALPAARRVSDPVSGYFAFRRDVWRPLDEGYRGYKLLLFVLAMADDQRIAEVPYRFEPRRGGASKLTDGRAFLRLYLVELLLARRIRRQLRRGPAVRSAVPGRSG
jgi:dolichol-phosphate mannosyltransferase